MDSPGQVAQWVGALSRAPKGFGFDPQSGHIPRLSVQSLVRVCVEATNRCFSHFDVSLSLSKKFKTKKIFKSINISLGGDLKKMKNTIGNKLPEFAVYFMWRSTRNVSVQAG